MSAQKETPASGDNHPAGVNTRNTSEIVNAPHYQVNDFRVLFSTAALMGYALKKVRTGYMLTRRSYQKHFTDIESVRALLNGRDT